MTSTQRRIQEPLPRVEDFELGRRPNILGPSDVQFVEIDADTLRGMSDGELREFCSACLGISTKPHWDRNKLLTAIMSAAAGCSNK